MATGTAAHATTAPGRPASTPRRDLAVALAALWLTGGLYLDGWAHVHVPELETFFTPWHGVLYSGYAALAVALVPAALWRGRPAGPVGDWVPAGYGPGLLGAVLFAAGGVVDMTWHTLLGVEADLEALLSPPHLLLLTAGMLMVTTPVRAAAARRAAPSPAGDLPVLLSMLSATGLAAFFLNYLSPFIDAPAAFDSYGDGGPTFGLAQHLTFTTLVVAATLFTWTRLGRVPAGLITVVVAAAAVPAGVFNDFEHLAAQLWPLAGAALADAAVRWTAARRPHLTPLTVGAAIPLLVWTAHLIGVQASLEVAWSVELWSGVVVLTTLAGAVLGILAGRAEQPRSVG
ncbi:hypothetical protein Daura_41950 [Dactylosporangium aurantiacum]|uniref:Uncharacterized protein n=1 Tax=Dactylosporangium aurantiacum TaxID=35754 RepID=A0A9Q9IFI8_9ACTN|nr:hypothetical protein [Dactylosporangium aurantiacum]MDG6102657.1 hypothetical protein [Dactylosporangium aurantiacum]UWZ53092.1 hypothetical protein Daura_41950 [Dactylosporangium aurantiacum]